MVFYLKKTRTSCIIEDMQKDIKKIFGILREYSGHMSKRLTSFRLPRYNLNEVRMMYTLSAVVTFVTLGLIGWFVYHYYAAQRMVVNDVPQDVEKKECVYHRVLDGICVDTEKEIAPQLIAIMIENHVDARPQAGLADARLVYEAPVEANYTRFLALYPKDASVKKAGPVRSARPYYLSWLTEWGRPLYMHVGGSPESLEQIKDENILDMNEFYRGWYYWRDDAREAPHHIYTSSELWQKAWDDYGSDADITPTTSWRFEDKKICAENCVYEITASFLPPVYEAVWKFNTSTAQYERYQMDEPHRDENGAAIVADTVIIQRVLSTTIDEIGRKRVNTTGPGDAIVFRDGYMTGGFWKKDGPRGRTQFINAQTNEPIALKPGKIWIELVPQDGTLKFK